MKLFLNTALGLSEDIIKKCNNINYYTTQLDCKNLNNMMQFIKNANYESQYEELIKNIILQLYILNTENKNENEINSNIELFIKICLLYLNGGIIINSNIRIINLEALKDIYNRQIVCVIQSCINKNSIFDGIIMSNKGNVGLLEIINSFLNNKETKINDLLLSKSMLLNEEIMNNKSNIFYKGQIIAEHYFKNKSLIEINKFYKPAPSDLSKLKIGITIAMPSNLKDFYSNGIKQNCLYLYELLNNLKYDVKLIIDDEKNAFILKNIDFYNFEYVTINNIFSYDFDLVFSLGFSIPTNIFNGLTNIGTKIVYYVCGNNYLIDSERILYDQHKTRNIDYENDKMYSQIWIIPQMYNQNKYYCEILNKTKCIEIPFIWSPMSIKFMTKVLDLENDSSLIYKKKDSKIGIFEPNISIMKWALPSLLIAENTYRNYKNISHVYVTNISNKQDNNINNFNSQQFNNVCKSLNLCKDRKISIESRYIILDFMSKHCDIVISHQWENPLNYLYLDLAWMGWPILHNAHLCKDVGYYYEGFNYYDGSEKLNHILTNHAANANEYIIKNRKTIDMYIPSNKELQNKYRNLIENLFA